MTENLPDPKSRKETYLAKAAGMTVEELPTPASREELYLNAIAEGGGGGGTSNFNDLTNRPKYNGTTMDGDTNIPEVASYTAGDGIDITNDEISVDTTTIQPKLTAGTNVSIVDDTISATDTTYSAFTGTDGTAAGTTGLVPAPATTDAGKFLSASGLWEEVAGGSGITELTTADYNYPTDNPTSVALWLLEPGVYVPATNSVSIKVNGATAASTRLAEALFLVSKEDGNGWKYISVIDPKKIAQSDNVVTSYKLFPTTGNVNATTTGLFSNNVLQATGTSQTDVMSQKAVTDALNALPTGGVTELTSADYNYPANNPASVALWLLEDGIYSFDNLAVRYNSILSYTATGMAIVNKATASSGTGDGLVLYMPTGDPAKLSRGIRTDGSGGTTSTVGPTIANNLTTVVTGLVLDASQGKVLKDFIGDLANLTTTDKTNLVAAINEAASGGGGGGSDIVEINYSDYNPTWASGTNLTVNFGQWLRSKNVHPGQAVRIINNGTAGHNSMYFYKGGANEERTLASYSLPYVVFYIVADCASENGTYTNFSVVSDLGGTGLVEWKWQISNNTFYFGGEKKFLSTQEISELGQMASDGQVMSGKSGAELNRLLQIATNITGLSKVNVQSPLASKEVLTFDQTMDEWDFEWLYTMQLDSSSSYNLATASVGSEVYIYCRDTNGLPLVYTPEYTFENYELTDNSGNTVSVPMTQYSWDGTTNTGQPVVFSAQELYLFKKFSDGWKCIGSANTPTFLPRTISA